MTNDDDLPDQPDESQWTDDPQLRREMDAFRGRTAKGQILRGGVYYDADKDFVTNTALRAILRDQADVIRMLTSENAELQQSLDAQTKFNSDLYRQQETLKAKQAVIEKTLANLSQRLQ